MLLAPIDTIADLIDICQKIDEDTFVENKYHPPPKTSNLNPELVYLSSCEPSTSSSIISIDTVDTFEQNKQQSKKYTTNFKKNSNKYKTNNIPKLNSKSSNSASTKVCWNCNLANHTYHYCRAKKNKFCYNCGKPNETVHTCKNCSKN